MLQFPKVLVSLCTCCFCTIGFHQLPVIGQILLPRTQPIIDAFEATQVEMPVPTAEETTFEFLPISKTEPMLTAPSNIYSKSDTTETTTIPVDTTTTTVPIQTTNTSTVTTTVTSIETVSPETTISVSNQSSETVNDYDLFDTYPTWFKAYMDYRTITDTNSIQYQIQQQAWTDTYGLRRLGDDYIVAMGTGWLMEGCGERFLVTLENEIQFTVTVGDIKADCHTDPTHRFRSCGGGANVLEFIVDTDLLSADAVQAGTVSVYPAFSGNIQRIERISAL